MTWQRRVAYMFSTRNIYTAVNAGVFPSAHRLVSWTFLCNVASKWYLQKRTSGQTGCLNLEDEVGIFTRVGAYRHFCSISLPWPSGKPCIHTCFLKAPLRGSVVAHIDVRSQTCDVPILQIIPKLSLTKSRNINKPREGGNDTLVGLEPPLGGVQWFQFFQSRTNQKPCTRKP